MKKLLVFFIMTICSNPLYASGAILKWDASTGDVSGYTIYYGISQENYPFSVNIGNVTQYSLSNFSLNEGTTYYFVIRAYNDFGESGNSNVTTYIIPSAGDNTPPLPPQSVTSEIQDENIMLTWAINNEIDISDYRVYYSTSSRNYGLPITVDKNEYLISGLDSNKTYYFAVTAVDTSGNESGYSSEIKKSISLQIAPTAITQSASIPSQNASYRFFNTITKAHFYTSNDLEKANIQSTLPHLEYEGVAFYGASDSNAAGVSPVYRFYNNNNRAHFYTISETERDNILATLPHFNLEGVAYYAYTTESPGTKALHRFFNTITTAHFYTTNDLEKANIQSTLPHLKYEGIAYYVE